MPGGVNTRILIIVWLVAGLVTTWGIRFALHDWFNPPWPGDVPVELYVVRGPARSALGLMLATGAIFSAMFITARMRGRK